ncbi:hypothetical protein [Natrarchaeobaculum sulfurireducens]|uniref:Uncharacterized protein n=1 Tax=Natrarchaeobaculum sulfurireducens TaxID=2044521 RepID=A0A346PHI8_9EURY|nr:hypothetical protein [Natrarchaeobaculum sulfurireducens]AXR78983.1 hypothetical protein AArc1_2670 [Natrarchaeobaculum sulfurireducens]
MATDGETPPQPPEDEMLPDEREIILERLDELEDADSHLTVEETAESLGIDLE